MKIENTFERGYLKAALVAMGDDYCVAVTGGDKPHLGCVSMAIAHPGITNVKEMSATVSTLVITGHRDDFIANMLAKKLGSKLKTNVTVACGIHFEEYSEDVLSEVLSAAEQLYRDILTFITGGKNGEN